MEAFLDDHGHGVRRGDRDQQRHRRTRGLGERQPFAGLVQVVDHTGDRGPRELRPQRRKPGTYWLGCKGNIYGVATTLPAERNDSVERFRQLLPLRRRDRDTLPYANAWGLPLTDVRRAAAPIPYRIRARRGCPERARRSR